MTFKWLVERVVPRKMLEPIKRWHYFREVKKSMLTDEPDLAILPSVIQSHFVCLDIGANVGVFTKHLSQLSQKVMAFEPIPQTFQYLSVNVMRLGLSNVSLYEVAISDRCGTVAMEPGQFIDGRPNYYRSHITGNRGPIECVTVDSLNLPSCHFIKLDVEGHERQVIAGAGRMISSSMPIWLIETEAESPLFQEMTSFGYSCLVEDNGSLRPRREREYRVNYWFVPNQRGS